MTFADDGIPATVIASSFLGSLRRTIVRLDDATVLTIQHDASDVKAAGAPCTIAFTGRPVSARRA